MVRSIFAAALLAVSALAIPLKNACDPSKASLTLPAGLTTAAGTPSAVLLGVGVQNYTCTDAGTYAAAGAVAELYDISCLIGTPLFTSSQDLAMGAWKLSRGGKAQDIVKQVLRSTSVFAGTHFFVNNPAGAGISPMWDQRMMGPKNPEAFVIGAKKGGVAAPVRPNAPKDVDWLEISNVQGKLATTIYRTDTREGVAPATCTPGSPLISVKYTSKYWLYGSTL